MPLRSKPQVPSSGAPPLAGAGGVPGVGTIASPPAVVLAGVLAGVDSAVVVVSGVDGAAVVVFGCGDEPPHPANRIAASRLFLIPRAYQGNEALPRCDGRMTHPAAPFKTSLEVEVRAHRQRASGQL